MGGKLPKILESKNTSTISDNPNGKRMTQSEHLLFSIDSSLNSLDEKRAAIDSRPNSLTELHRTRMHETIRTKKKSNVWAEASDSKHVSIASRKSKPEAQVQCFSAEPEPPAPATGDVDAKVASAKRRWRK